jgi:NADP-dependent 3-hydroxy acid dehydrogenase YdfG
MELDQQSNDRPRIAAVTGASSGVGVAIAEALARAGWRVAIGARRVDRLEAVAQRLRAEGATVLAHALDVTDPGSVDAFCAAAETELGPIDTLVNNAGMAHPARLGEAEHSDVARVIEVCLTGSILMSNRVLRTVRERDVPSGDIILISSDAAVDATPLVTSYGAAKAGLEHFARCLRLELEGTRVRVGVIRIGQVESEFAAGWGEAALGELLAEWQRLGVLRQFVFLQPADVGEATVHMASQPAGRKLDFLEVRALPPETDSAPAGSAAAQAVQA